MRPKSEFWICVTKPEPWQVVHCSGEVPGWHIAPWQVSHRTCVLKETSFAAPNAASSRVMSTVTCWSLPRRTREAGPCEEAPKPPVNMASKMSEKPVKGAPPPVPPPCKASGPPMSYIWRFSGSDRVS